MNLHWLLRNAAVAWRGKAAVPDVFRRLLWTYGINVGRGRTRTEWTIGFRYPAVGEIHLSLRANSGADAFIHSEVFEHQYYRLPLSSPPATILDLGANIGLTAVYFGRVFPKARIACVEPHPDNLRLLRKNIEANAIDAVVFAAAADVRDGEVVLEVDPKDYGHTIAKPGTAVTSSALAVRALSVPSMLETLGWDRIGLLKIDIEGHEKVLLGENCDWLFRVDAICIECHDGYGEDDLQRLAGRFGFGTPSLLPGVWFLTREAETPAISPDRGAGKSA